MEMHKFSITPKKTSKWPISRQSAGHSSRLNAWVSGSAEGGPGPPDLQAPLATLHPGR